MASIQKDSWSVDQPFARMKGSNIDICVGKAINSVDFVVGVSFLLPLVLSYLHTRSHHAYEGRKLSVLQVLLNCYYFVREFTVCVFIDSFIGIWTAFALPFRTAFQHVWLL